MTSEADELARQLAHHVIEQSECMDRGQVLAGNEHARKYLALWKSLMAIGDAGREALVPFMRSDREDVRGVAASYLLRYRTIEARRVLKGVEKSSNFMLSVTAGMHLRRWEEGTWQLDPL